MVDPDLWTGMDPSLLPVSITFAPPKLRKHYYECHACKDYVMHNCKSGWKSNPVLMPIDEKNISIGVLTAQCKKVPEEFDYHLYLKKRKDFQNLSVDEDNRTIRCTPCSTIIFTVTKPTKEPRLGVLQKHIASKTHQQKLALQNKAHGYANKKPTCILCDVCNKYVDAKNYKRHVTLAQHMNLQAKPKTLDLTAVTAKEANQTMVDKFKEAMLASGISNSVLKKIQPFIREYCVGGGAFPKRRKGESANVPKEPPKDDSGELFMF